MSGYTGPCSGVGRQTTYGTHCGNMGPPNGLSDPVHVMQSTANGEKADMQGLNDRLSAYIQRIRAMKQNTGAIDPALYHENLRILENELMKLKNMYEQELDRLRRALDDCNRDKNACMSHGEKNGSIISDLEARLAAEAEKARRALDDLARCQQCLCQREKELCDLKANLKAACDELNDLRNKHNRDSGGINDLRNQLEKERQGHQAACDLVRQLQDKLNFDKQLCDTEKKDLQDRVNASDGIIRQLEDKIRQLTSRPDNDMGKVLQNLRDSHAAELRRAQAETEQALNKSLGTLKGQLDDEARCKGELGRQKSQLEDCIRQLQAKIAELEGQLNGCCQQKNNLENMLGNERQRAQNEIRCLEEKLKQLQDMIMNKMKECNNARDIQMSLKGEIDAYKGLLDAEEARLRGGNSVCPPSGPICPPSGPICPPRTQVTFNAQSTGYTPPTGGYNQCSTSYSAGGLNTALTNGSNPFAAMCSQYANAASNGHQQKRITLDLNCGSQSARPGARIPPPCSERGNYQYRSMTPGPGCRY